VGNACSFLVTWAIARRLGWRVLLRIEDLDRDRSRAGGAQDVLAELGWLGIDFDGEPVLQSARLDRYEDAMARLAAQGLVYESPHSRAEVREAAAALSAPHADDAPSAFPASLRPAPGPAWGFVRRDVNHRMRMDPGTERVDDRVAGERTFEPARTEGDVIAWTKAGWPSYQLAVSVDDAAQGVTDVVRGEDLLPSAAVQARIHRALGNAPPAWWHLPLVVDGAGERLAKRRGGLSIDALRAAGADPARVRGLVAWWAGALAGPEPVAADRLPALLDEPILRAWHARTRTAPSSIDERALAWLHGR
jgi:glutamyl-tRNA synthetase